ncbi:MAG: hypothetical protein D6806_13415 [Deltaproteobacteria bacterium]|nr:MAG: hypothetical protein D6806_13415 [Deltaproteobacteria bacterium]
MQKRAGSILFVVSLSTLFAGCVTFRDRVVPRTQEISITSEPAGATITVVDENGSHVLGRTPTTYTGTYDVTERTYDKGTCAAVGAAEGASIVDDGDDQTSEGELVLGTIAAIAGAAVGAAQCHEADGVVAIRGSSTTVSAEPPGYRQKETTITVPRTNPSVHFDLTPQAGVASGTRGGSSSGWKYDLALFDIVDPSRVFEPETIADVSQRLKTSLVSAAEFEGRVLDADAALLASDGRPPRGKAERLVAARSLGAWKILDLRVVRLGHTCFLTAVMSLTTSGGDELLSSQQFECTPEGLEEAAQRVTDLLLYPPEVQPAEE